MTKTKTLGEIKKISLTDSSYPFLLKNISNPPSVIYFLGELPAEEIPKIAIVGTRKATNQGKLLAKRFAYDLSKKGLIVVSGLALGIDACSHEGALAAQAPTIAVLANGLDDIYPRQHFHLASKILDFGGAIISEYDVGTPAYPDQFLARNRIISGLCLGVVIIEAPIHSGALATARWALEQGREVFIVPGPVDHLNYEGSHLLLREGGRLVRNADDIIEDLSLKEKLKEIKNDKNNQKEIDTSKNESLQKILDSLDKKSLTIDEIIKKTNLSSQLVSQNLTFLILKGKVEEKFGKYRKIK